MSKRNWKLFVVDILESIKKIERYIAGFSYNEFINDEKTIDAVVRNLEIIGEATNQIPMEIRQRNKEVPWSQIVGLRNRLIHGYFVIDYEIVWYIANNELPELKKQIEKILNGGSNF